MTRTSRARGRHFFLILCAKEDCGELAFYYPILIGLQPLTQSVRASNALHLLHNNTQTLLMMYEQRDAVQNTECSSPESLEMLSFVCLCVCVLMHMCRCASMCVYFRMLTHSSLVIYTVT